MFGALGYFMLATMLPLIGWIAIVLYRQDHVDRIGTK